MSTAVMRKAYVALGEQSADLTDLDAQDDVIKAVLFAITNVDNAWTTQGMPGQPSVTDYAAGVATFLEIRYDKRRRL